MRMENMACEFIGSSLTGEKGANIFLEYSKIPVSKNKESFVENKLYELGFKKVV